MNKENSRISIQFFIDNEEEIKRLEELKIILNNKTNSKVMKILLKHGKL